MSADHSVEVAASAVLRLSIEKAAATTASADLVWLSQWIDAGNAHRDPEAVTWGRLAKVSEECGEVVNAFIGLTGQNPRKGVYGDVKSVVEELLDVAVTALGAIEHLTDHAGEALPMLTDKIRRVTGRARSLDGTP